MVPTNASGRREASGKVSGLSDEKDEIRMIKANQAILILPKLAPDLSRIGSNRALCRFVTPITELRNQRKF